MVIFIDIYGIVALAVFFLFLSPVFPEWKDFSAKELGGCALFAAAMGVLWPAVALLLVASSLCGAYYSRKEAKEERNDD